MIFEYIKICHSCEFRKSKEKNYHFCDLDNLDIIDHCVRALCPKNKFSSITVENKPLPTPIQIITFAQALVTGRKVSLEIMNERTEICKKCEFARQTDDGDMWCGKCGCSVSTNDKKIQNLAAYEENLPIWGCKYPDKSKGGWKPIEKAAKNEPFNLAPTQIL